MGQELSSDASPKALMERRQQQVLQKLLMKKREAQEACAAAQGGMMQQGQDIRISVPWTNQQQYVLQRELQQARRQELVANLSGKNQGGGSMPCRLED